MRKFLIVTHPLTLLAALVGLAALVLCLALAIVAILVAAYACLLTLLAIRVREMFGRWTPPITVEQEEEIIYLITEEDYLPEPHLAFEVWHAAPCVLAHEVAARTESPVLVTDPTTAELPRAERIERALVLIRSGGERVRAAARLWNVPESTLRARLKGGS
jgi:hypothetical protein